MKNPFKLSPLFLFVLLPNLHARNDDYAYYNQPSYAQPNYVQPRVQDQPFVKIAQYENMQFTKDMFEGGIKGDFIEKPNVANTIGNVLASFTPAYLAVSARDFVANFTSSFKSGFKEHKLGTALCAMGFVPAIVEGKNIARAFKVAQEARIEANLAIEFAPAIESGLTRKLQTAITQSLNDGEFVAVRSRAYGANLLDGKLPAKALGMAEVKISYKNGVRLLQDNTRTVSDLDLAFVVKHGEIVPETKAIQVGEKINETYGHFVVTHGDNFNGARRGIEKAIEIENKNERIWIFGRDGFIGTGDYQTIIKKFLTGR